METYGQRFTKLGLLGVVLFVLGPILIGSGFLLIFTAGPILEPSPPLGMLLLTAGIVVAYFSLPAMLIGRTYVREHDTDNARVDPVNF